MVKSSTSNWNFTVRWLAPGVIALALTWEILSRTVATFLIASDPNAALSLASDNAEAMIRLADRTLGQDPDVEQSSSSGAPHQSAAVRAALVGKIVANGVPSPMIPPDIGEEDRARVRAWATESWLRDPFDPRAPRILGQLADTDDVASQLMRRSRKLSLHEPLTNYWLIQDAFLRGDYPATLAYADVLLRTQPETARLVTPILVRVVEARHEAALLESYLRANPPWRRAFFGAMPASVTDPKTPFNLLMDLKANGIAPTHDEIGFCLAYLVEHRLYDLAHMARTALVRDGDLANNGLLLDGNFDSGPTGLPFDWRFQFSGGVRISIARAPGKPESKAVKLEFLEQFIPQLEITQMLALVPGSYHLSGQTSGVYSARHGLHWTVSCADTRYTPFSQSERIFGLSAEWRDFFYDFTVPADNCPAQYLNLTIDALSDSERIVSGAAWFTGLKLAKLP